MPVVRRNPRPPAYTLPTLPGMPSGGAPPAMGPSFTDAGGIRQQIADTMPQPAPQQPMPQQPTLGAPNVPTPRVPGGQNQMRMNIAQMLAQVMGRQGKP